MMDRYHPTRAAAVFAAGLLAGAAMAPGQCVEWTDNAILKDPGPFCARFAADMGLAVGPTKMFFCTNCSLALYDRATAQWTRMFMQNTQPSPPTGFFTAASFDPPPTGHRIFDPRVHYDIFDDVFWLVACEQDWMNELAPRQWNYNFGRLHIAVSKPGMTPQSFDDQYWHKYTGALAVDVQNPAHVGAVHLGFPDRITINVDEDWLYVSSRDFPCYGSPQDCTGYNFQNDYEHDTVVYIFPKAPLLDGTYVPGVNPPGPVFGQRLPDPPCPAPPNCPQRTTLDVMAATYEPDTAPQYTLAQEGHQVPPPWEPPQAEENLVVEAWVGLSGGQFNRHTTLVRLPPQAQYWEADNIACPPPGGVAAAGRMFMQAVYRDGFLYGAIQMRTDEQSTQTIIRWFKIAMNNWPAQSSPGPQLVHWDDIVPGATDEATAPAIAVNARGDVCVQFTVCGPSTNPQVWRAAYDSSGTTINVHAVLPSECTGSLLLDYTDIEPDPLDNCYFWGHDATAEASQCPSGLAAWHSRLLHYCICTDIDVDFLPDGQYNAGDQAVFDVLFLQQQQEADFVRDGILDALDRAAVEATLRSRRRE